MSATPAVAQAPQGWVQRFRNNPTSLVGLAMFLAVVLAAVFAPWIWPVDPLEQDVVERLIGPSLAHPLGTDSFGRDVLARLLHAGRISLLIGVSSIALAMLAGSAIGIAAGYIGGWFDALVTSLLDVLLSFPTLLLGLMVVAMLGSSIENLVLAIALTELKIPEALDGLAQAVGTDYGAVGGRSRNPEVRAHVVRLAAMRFPADPRTATLLSAAAGSPHPSVRFLALVQVAMGLLARPVLVAIKSRLDAGQYNGGALLGLRGLVFKSHGSADVRAFGYALERAYDASRHDLLDRVKARVARAAPLLAVSGAVSEG